MRDRWFRLRRYLTSHGLCATCRRAAVVVGRRFFRRRVVILGAELNDMPPPPDLHDGLSVTCVESESQLRQEDRAVLLEKRGAEIMAPLIQRRFGYGADLWLLKRNDTVVGMLWSLPRETWRPHVFPLTPRDILLLDAEVFPEFRGQGMNPLLTRHVLHGVKNKGYTRAYIHVAIWNTPQLRSLRKTPFRRLGAASQWVLPGRNVVVWNEMLGQMPAQGQSGDDHGPGSLSPNDTA